MCSPLAGYSFDDVLEIVSNPFVAPRPGKDDGHHGIDLAHYAFGDRTTIAGVPVAAVLEGTVAAAIAGSWPYGNFVIIETRPDALPAWFSEAAGPPSGLSVYHLYAHLEAPPGLAIGDALDCGDTFGLVGNSGWSGNFHLHFEIRFGPPGEVFDAMSYYLTTTTVEERANYERWRFGGGEFTAIDPLPVIEAADP
jgi:murein DD-endopeptidase MepM/ murein hydrolase activator NlpD